MCVRSSSRRFVLCCSALRATLSCSAADDEGIAKVPDTWRNDFEYEWDWEHNASLSCVIRNQPKRACQLCRCVLFLPFGLASMATPEGGGFFCWCQEPKHLYLWILRDEQNKHSTAIRALARRSKYPHIRSYKNNPRSLKSLVPLTLLRWSLVVSCRVVLTNTTPHHTACQRAK